MLTIINGEFNPCQCGCGGNAGFYSDTSKKRGYKKGQPRKFIKGHYAKTITPKGKYVDSDGYVNIWRPYHPSATVRKTVPEHRLVVEKVLGRNLKQVEIVHHADLNKSNNNNNNLVVCQDSAYHRLLHARTAAYFACGNANYKKCHFCHQYDDVNNMTLLKKYNWAYHKQCNAKYHKLREQHILQTLETRPELDDRPGKEQAK